MYMHIHVCVRACVRACLHVCVCVYVYIQRVGARAYTSGTRPLWKRSKWRKFRNTAGGSGGVLVSKQRV